MISWPLLKRTHRDYRLLVLGAFLLLLAFMILFNFAIDSLNIEQRREWLNVEWIRRLITTIMGADAIDLVTPTGMVAFGFTHPVVWMVAIAFVLAATTGLFTGEIDRGTIDVLASLPVSRVRIYVTQSLYVALSGAPICAALVLGTVLGRRLTGSSPFDLKLLVMMATHLYVTFVFLVAVCTLASVIFSRRSAAMTACFFVFFYSFVLRLLEGFWPAAKRFGCAGFLHYYEPAQVALQRRWQADDIAVLLAGAATAWLAGLIVFNRRDLPAR